VGSALRVTSRLGRTAGTGYADRRGIARVKVRWHPRVRFHDLRHTFATHVQAGLGDLRVTRSYWATRTSA
jgi:integrase